MYTQYSVQTMCRQCILSIQCRQCVDNAYSVFSNIVDNVYSVFSVDNVQTMHTQYSVILQTMYTQYSVLLQGSFHTCTAFHGVMNRQPFWPTLHVCGCELQVRIGQNLYVWFRCVIWAKQQNTWKYDLMQCSWSWATLEVQHQRAHTHACTHMHARTYTHIQQTLWLSIDGVSVLLPVSSLIVSMHTCTHTCTHAHTHIHTAVFFFCRFLQCIKRLSYCLNLKVSWCQVKPLLLIMGSCNHSFT